MALEAAPVVVAERTYNEVPAPNRKLIVATAARGPEITTTAGRRRAGELNARRTIDKAGILLVPEAIAAATANVASGPGRRICDRSRRAHRRPDGHVGCKCRSAEGRDSRQCDCQLFHLKFLSDKGLGCDRMTGRKCADSQIPVEDYGGSRLICC